LGFDGELASLELGRADKSFVSYLEDLKDLKES